MFAGVSVLTDLRQDVLHQTELIRHKGIGFNEIIFTSIALQIQHGIIEGKQVFENSAVLAVTERQHIRGVVGLRQNTLFDDLIYGGGREA